MSEPKLIRLPSASPPAKPEVSQRSWNVAFWAGVAVILGVIVWGGHQTTQIVSNERVAFLREEYNRDFIRNESQAAHNRELAENLVRSAVGDMEAAFREEIRQFRQQSEAELSEFSDEIWATVPEVFRVFLTINNGPVGLMIGAGGEWIYATDAIERYAGGMLEDLVAGSSEVLRPAGPSPQMVDLGNGTVLEVYDYEVELADGPRQVRIVLPRKKAAPN